MSEDLHNIDDLFKNALNDHEEEPSAGVWENIDRKLDKKSVVHIKRKYRRVRWVAAASILVASAMAMYTFYIKKYSPEIVKENRQERKITTPGTRMNETAYHKNEEQIIPEKPSAAESINLVQPKKEEEIAGNQPAKGQMLERETVVEPPKKQSVQKPPILPERKVEKEAVEKPVPANELAKTTDKIPGAVKKNTQENHEDIANKQNELTKTDAYYNISTPISELLATLPKQFDLSIGNAQVTKRPTAVGNIFTREEKFITQRPLQVKARQSSFTPPKFSLTAFFSPESIWQRVEDDHHQFREDDRNEIKRRERASFSYSTGVLASIDLGKNFTLQPGISYSVIEKTIQQKPIFARPDDRGEVRYRLNSAAGYSFINLKSGTPPAAGDSLFALHSSSSLHYLQVPLSIGYKLGNGRFNVVPAVGFAINILAKKQLETEIIHNQMLEKAVTKDVQGLKPSYLSGLLNIAASYRVTDKWSISIRPAAKFALGSINKDAPVKTFQNSVGVAIGAGYSF